MNGPMSRPVPVTGEDLDAELASSVEPLSALGQFNRAGILAAADIHVARALGRLGRDDDELVGLAVALAVRAPRVGHVLVDLSTIRETAVAGSEEETDPANLPWPSLGLWLERVKGSPLIAVDDDGPADRPLRLVGSRLYLDRYWQDEQDVAVDLTARSSAGAPEIDEAVLAEGLVRLYPLDSSGLQRQAATTVLHRLLTVIAGGPGTGKTTTVARVLALVAEQAVEAGRPFPTVALVAPTGKAAARMAEAVHDEARRLDIREAVRGWLLSLDASTVHRLLGRRPGTATRFRYEGHNQLPYDVVVVDETSMMSLPLMARLVDAVRKDARLVLIGDQEQLASVEAGAVLGDIVGPAATTGRPPPHVYPPIGRCITVLQANYRFSGPLAELALAVRSGNGDAVMAVLDAGRSAGRNALEGDSNARWLDIDVATAQSESLEPVRSAVLTAQQLVADAAQAGDAPAALDALGRLRLLCAHREGPTGAGTWNSQAEQWLAGVGEGPPLEGGWYLGRPVIVTENDYGLGLFNGDTGVVIAEEESGLRAAFRRGAGVVSVSPARLGAVETAFAMTVHRAQGSEFDEVVVLLPSASSRVLTRELLYTAVTRARRSVVLVGTEESVRSAVDRPVARASGLTARLWG
jgi:exodeoxyribonuclease V alpha subunit